MDMRVLIADPDGNLLEQYAWYLREFGIQVVTASSALECVNHLRDFRPHILVLDPDLPWGRGEGVLDLMQSEQDVPLVPVIVLSSLPHSAGLHHLGAIEVAEYHQKPLLPRDMLAAVVRVRDSVMPRPTT